MSVEVGGGERVSVSARLVSVRGVCWRRVYVGPLKTKWLRAPGSCAYRRLGNLETRQPTRGACQRMADRSKPAKRLFSVTAERPDGNSVERSGWVSTNCSQIPRDNDEGRGTR